VENFSGFGGGGGPTVRRKKEHEGSLKIKGIILVKL